ncbi:MULTISPECIES: aldehyde dehydrogenase family protein [unclassified Rhodococcus (in: high G+C Gram-positive bacteria)]|uniref:aldehyde dehydrogenase family protein n=1 Tax=unclassified Rhodococcus (in: high G+C Gram-positive bacteria) TaxID=192944 RepID=UPI001639C578|nr:MULTISPECIES: aldehyde dehydrogenase family protein [unclassified Rhodococcus (in: high G+C Gram-positive bacteria)]MBC2637907.1 aldehyde dehydrogenase family protein [Rhodococcus sp. 3A]MBC2897345.1 aldehyde dehydrogenase family protein [Rhodococcus sp. 4CII]
MDHTQKFYIDGTWVDPIGSKTLEVINPATEKPIATIAMGNEQDVDLAVTSARKAFDSFASTTPAERIALLEKIIAVYKRRMKDLAAAVTSEMGAPTGLAEAAQAPAGLGHFMATLDALRNFTFEEKIDTTTVVREPVGVCAFITPWNWPLNQIVAKVAPALAAGCTMVLKPSEIAPLNAIIFAEILDEAGVPAGVFNLINGDGPTVGTALSAHPAVDMVSFTGSTRAGVEVAKNAAPTVKRVAQELGGKSANIVLDDADFEDVITRDVTGMVVNSGQSCNAGSRILIPSNRMNEAVEIAKKAAATIVVGAPDAKGTTVGPVVSQAQFDKIQGLIQKGIDEGGTLVVGGTGRPDGLQEGYFVKPTVFADVTNDMTIAQEEIFGPVMMFIGYEDEDDAVRIANDTQYGLAGMVSSGNPERARRVARRMRTGMVHLNGAPLAANAPFGGYKQSGNGREFGKFGLEDFLEVKAIFGDNQN